MCANLIQKWAIIEFEMQLIKSHVFQNDCNSAHDVLYIDRFKKFLKGRVLSR